MSSFRKRNVQKPLPGTRTSPQTGQVITSSGNPSMDALLGGGLPIGSICLIEEDRFVSYSKVLARYFLAEGILSKQTIFLGSLDDDLQEFLRRLPKPLSDEELSQQNTPEKQVHDEPAEVEGGKNGLRIAWRYTDLPLLNSEQTNAKIGHHFNLLERMDPLMMDFSKIHLWSDGPSDGPISVAEEKNEKNENEDFSKGDIIDELFADLDITLEDLAEPVRPVKRLPPPPIIKLDVNEQFVKNTRRDEPEKPDNRLPPASIGKVDVDEQFVKNARGDEPEKPDNRLPPASIGKVDVEEQPHEQTFSIDTKQKARIFWSERYTHILKEITSLLGQDKFNPAKNHYEKGLCRVCITSLASPLWYGEQFAADLLKFFTVLRAAIHNSTAVCFITLPMHLVAKSDACLPSKIRNLVDYAIELESFTDTQHETNPVFRDYSGLIHMHKISALNTLSAFVPETCDLAFKLRRKKFVIEKLHLPPELQDSQNIENHNATQAFNTLGCGSNVPATQAAASLDF